LGASKKYFRNTLKILENDAGKASRSSFGAVM
jgi:hypothetical protein